MKTEAWTRQLGLVVAICLIASPLTAGEMLMTETRMNQDQKESANTSGQDESGKMQQRATQIMREDIGVWKCRWEFLDSEGNVVKTAAGTQVNKFVIEDKVMQVTMDVPDMEIKSVAHKFFNPTEKQFLFTSVDNKGDFWQFFEKVGEENSKSRPHKNPDGSVTYLRFKTLRKTDDEVDVVMEMSSDDKNWAEIFKQYRVRAKTP